MKLEYLSTKCACLLSVKSLRVYVMYAVRYIFFSGYLVVLLQINMVAMFDTVHFRIFCLV
jgi:hypothetical protein